MPVEDRRPLVDRAAQVEIGEDERREQHDVRAQKEHEPQETHVARLLIDDLVAASVAVTVGVAAVSVAVFDGCCRPGLRPFSAWARGRKWIAASPLPHPDLLPDRCTAAGCRSRTARSTRPGLF